MGYSYNEKEIALVNISEIVVKNGKEKDKI